MAPTTSPWRARDASAKKAGCSRLVGQQLEELHLVARAGVRVPCLVGIEVGRDSGGTGCLLDVGSRKIHQAKLDGQPRVEIWGTGTPRREFLHADDLADATVFATKHYSGETHLDVGVGQDIAIAELAELIADVVGWYGEFTFNTDMPDGTPRKLLDVSRMEQLGWKPTIGLRDGIADAYQWLLDHVEDARGV